MQLLKSHPFDLVRSGGSDLDRGWSERSPASPTAHTALPSLSAFSIVQEANPAVSPLLQIQHPENKLEPSPFTSANGVSQDLSLNDQVVAILTSEEPGSMLQALEE